VRTLCVSNGGLLVMASGWAVAHTHPREEDRVVWHAGKLGFEAWCPKIKYKRRRRTQHHHFAFREEPLFPRYVLIRISERWYDLLSLFGLSRLIMSTSLKPALLQEWVVEGLKNGCDPDGFFVMKKFVVGQSVRVEKGVLAGTIGIYDGQLPHDRIAVLIEMLGTTVRASVREDDVVAV
jgi:transcription antitermination factor NusG